MRLCNLVKRNGGMAFLLLLSMAVHAQQSLSRITGIVVTEKGEALAGVSITLKTASGKEKQSMMTNVSGMFEFANLRTNTRYNFSFSYVGYGDTTVNGFERRRNETNWLVGRMGQAP